MRNPFATAYKPLPYYSSSIENILPTGQFWFLVLISRRRKEIKKEKGKERDKRALTRYTGWIRQMRHYYITSENARKCKSSNS
jgi:hypothetical protein